MNHTQQQFNQMWPCNVNEIQQQRMSLERNHCHEGEKTGNKSFDAQIMDTSATLDTQNSSTDNKQFVYEFDKTLLVFQCTSTENYIMKCPRCKKETRYIIRHLSQKNSCKNGINHEEFKKQFFNYKKGMKDPYIEKQKQR